MARAVAEAQRSSAAKRPAEGGDGRGAKRAAPKTGGMMALPAVDVAADAALGGSTLWITHS